jgi:flap endonuclease-1
LIDLAILVGTDYNPGGVEKIGPKKAYDLIKKYGNAKKAIKEMKITLDFDIEEIKRLFLEPATTGYRIEWNRPNTKGIIDFLCGERDFSVDRVEKALEKLESKAEKQETLEKWF